MTVKDEIVEMIKRLPDDADADDILEALLLRIKIDAAGREIEEGRGIPHEQVKEHFRKWLT